MKKVRRLHSRAKSLAITFQKGGETSCINEAIALGREALERCPLGHRRRSLSLTSLATYLTSRYIQCGEAVDLDEAIDFARKGLDLRPSVHPDRSTSLNILSICLRARYQRSGQARDLDDAILLGREALQLRPPGHRNRSTSLNNLAACLSSRYGQLGTTEDLDEVIVLNLEALELRQPGDPDRPTSLNNLAVSLSTRYRQFGMMEDLDMAIAFNLEALYLCPPGHPEWPMYSSNLASDVSTRFDQLGMMEDLDVAIGLDREALDLCPHCHPNRPMHLNNLSIRLLTRYTQFGLVRDLDEAIILGRTALGLISSGHSNRPSYLSNLAVGLSARYKQLRIIEDLEEAIALNREALCLRPQGHPAYPKSLGNLAIDLCTRYNKFGTIEDLNEAIVLDLKALDLRPHGHSERLISLNNLAVHLSTRHDQLGAMEDLDEALVLDREALDLSPSGHPGRPVSLNNLAIRLHFRYMQLGTIENLEEAIVLEREALHLCLPGHPNRSQSLKSLAGSLRSRFTRLHQPEDKEELFSLYAQLEHVSEVVSYSDLSAARTWISVAEDFRHPTTLLAYETYLRLVTRYLATLPSLPQHLDVLKSVMSSLGVDAFSAALRSCSPTKAVELLEQGRGVFWNQLARLRSPLDDVIASCLAGKALADEFIQLTSFIRHVLNSPDVDQHEKMCHLNLEMERVVSAIRELPGLSHFLLPSPFSELRLAASCGPVIIVNASNFSCDALIVLHDRDPVHIPLSITKCYVQHLSSRLRTLTARATLVDVTRDLGIILRELWDDVVSPVVDFLRTEYPLQSRIWWCPTAEFCELPLHAAGPYRKGQHNLPDLYISSYTLTLGDLIRARRKAPVSCEKRFIAIGQATAIGESELLSVGTELTHIGQRVKTLATFTQIEGPDSCMSRVAEELGKNEWVHLACHGLSNRPKPFESAFALYDGHFTIEHIIRCDLENPEFAYLSACHTTVGDEDSPDEVIHLASAMQFAGFRSVIGTMWAVDDGGTNRITTTFYKYMVDESGRLDHTRAAYALNKTMRSVNAPLDQRVLYIHLGA